MIHRIKAGLASEKLSQRIVWLALVFAAVFFGGTVLSYFLLPEGFLLRKNSVADFRTSENLLLCALQIFLYNMLSVAVIFFGSAFAKKKEEDTFFLSYGTVGFLVFILLNAVTLGTWSFTVNTNAVPLMDRLLRTFDIVHNAGLVEMSGQLLITAALATKYLVMTEGKQTTSRKLSQVPISRADISALICGFLLMFLGAMIESRAIIG